MCDGFNVGFAAITLYWRIVTVDQNRVLPGVSLRATRRLSLSWLHQVVTRSVASHPHCGCRQRECLRQVTSFSRPANAATGPVDVAARADSAMWLAALVGLLADRQIHLPPYAHDYIDTTGLGAP